MKKIRLTNLEEMEIYQISDNKEALNISFLNTDASQIERIFSISDNLSIIQYYVGEDIMKGYAGYTVLQKYEKQMNKTLSIDYSMPDPATESGFHETTVDILTITLARPPIIREVAAKTAQNTADIDYIAMETGVNV